MPPSSTDRFLTVPVRAIRSSKKHLHLISCQEPVRRPPRLLRLLRVLKALEAPRLLKLSRPSEPLVQLK